MRRRVFLGLCLCVSAAVLAEGPPKSAVEALAAAWLAQRPAPGFAAGMSMDEAVRVREAYTALIDRDLGPVAGYKAALTNPAIQRRFGWDQPVRGTLYARMILSGGAKVPAAFGSHPVWEADLVAVVGDAEKLMAARTPLEALAGIQAFRPFIELPDLVFEPQVKLDGPSLCAINAAARLGVLGPPVRLPPTQASADRLAAMRVEALDGTGKRLALGTGSDILGNPLNAVLWLAASLRAEGRKLRAGEILSLGSYSPLLTPAPGLTATVRYTGLDDRPVEVSVRFE
ncbi:MAG: hypothetical protein KA419_06810 [Acidobacteria bacterium]|nr:hypothetical protein [Acidobacteriota bacterium]